MIEWEDVVDSVQLDQVLDNLGISVLSITRGEHWASCELPTHPGNDSSPSFSINEDTLLWNCFTCNEGGLLPSLVAKLLGFESDDSSSSFQKGIEWLLPYSDVDVDSDTGFMEQLDRYLQRSAIKVHRVRSEPMPFFNPSVIEKLALAPVELLAQWHIFDQKTVEHFGIRFDPQRERVKGGKMHVGPALVIPHWFRGELVGYQERWLGDRPKWIPKYTNSDDFPRAQTLFAWDSAVEDARRGTPVTVVEAAMTVIRLWEIDYAAVATFGAGVRDEQIKLLASLPAGVILATDDDPDYVNNLGQVVKGAGAKAFLENADRLSRETSVWTLPSIGQEKADLADVDNEVVEDLYSRRKAVFSLQTAPKVRTKRDWK